MSLQEILQDSEQIRFYVSVGVYGFCLASPFIMGGATIYKARKEHDKSICDLYETKALFLRKELSRLQDKSLSSKIYEPPICDIVDESHEDFVIQGLLEAFTKREKKVLGKEKLAEYRNLAFSYIEHMEHKKMKNTIL